MGVHPGFADLVVLSEGRVLFLELKASKGRLRPDQEAFRDAVLAQGLNWHFDRSEFTTTLLLQAPVAGGTFEYRSDLRTETDPNYDGVARLLRGQDPALKAITLAPGTLNVFRGKNTAHRVTPVEGDVDRIIAVFSFYDRPGMRFTPEEQKGFYGRVAG